MAWVAVADRFEGPYDFQGKEYIDSGRHPLYLAAGAQGHTREQMKAYGQASREQALTEAMQACEAIDDRCWDCLGHNEHDQCRVPEKEQYIEAIRSLK